MDVADKRSATVEVRCQSSVLAALPIQKGLDNQLGL